MKSVRLAHSQGYEEVSSVVIVQRQASSSEIHIHHGQQILQTATHTHTRTQHTHMRKTKGDVSVIDFMKNNNLRLQ